MKIKKELYRNYINLSGLKSKEKLVVIESDDWGGIRMPSKEVFETLKGSSIRVEKCAYSKFDALELNSDYENLYEVLSKHKDKDGNSPVITANFLTANPDFKRIKEHNFEQYFFEDITAAYNNYDGSDRAMSLINDGVKSGMLSPQLHGREHINPIAWLDLVRNNPDVRKAFDYNISTLSFENVPTIRVPYLASFYRVGGEDFKAVLTDAHKQFREIFNEYPKSFIAPVYVWDDEVENITAALGITSIQGLHYKYADQQKTKKLSRTRSTKTQYGQLNIVRNCFFEPSTKSNFDWVNECLSDINAAFRWNRPAVICSHRLNFTGRIDVSNRDTNLKLLNKLISELLKKWPDARFVSSDGLSKKFLG